MSEEIRKLMDEMVIEIKSHQDLVVSLTNAFDNSIERLTGDTSEILGKLSTLKDKIPVIEGKIAEFNATTSRDSASVVDLKPKLEAQKQLITDLNTMIGELEIKIKSIFAENKKYQIKLVSLVSELSERTAVLENLQATNSSRKELGMRKLREGKDTLVEIDDRYWVLDYIYKKIDLPEVEILGIIAGNRNISLESIKEKARDIQAVLVGRALSKLEADSKIVQVAENQWDLSPQLLSQL